MSDCSLCRFAFINNREGIPCDEYRDKYSFGPGCKVSDGLPFYQPILKSGMKVKSMVTGNIFTLKKFNTGNEWSTEEIYISINITEFDFYKEKENKMEIDIRKEEVDEILSIRFGDSDLISLNKGSNCITIKSDIVKNYFGVFNCDIDHLIKALHKVKELKGIK